MFVTLFPIIYLQVQAENRLLSKFTPPKPFSIEAKLGGTIGERIFVLNFRRLEGTSEMLLVRQGLRGMHTCLRRVLDDSTSGEKLNLQTKNSGIKTIQSRIGTHDLLRLRNGFPA